ncbi:MAG TPA: MBL fold metallo-hydrolase [Anaerolineae bacterium]|nr:MBL fold metallo-hydrolase [Anaerolineae bacterium]
MSSLVILGTAAAVHDALHENTYLVLKGARESILIDCCGNPLGRLQRAGVSLSTLNTIILTHDHPDHTYGLPILLMDLWLLGRSTPLKIYAPASTIVTMKAIMQAHAWADWPRFYPVEFKAIPDTIGAAVLENEEFTITAAPGVHFVPVVGLRVKNRSTGYAIMYTSDTAPADPIKQLALGVNLLLHETAGATFGHSSAAMAGALAREAHVEKLILIHYPVNADQAALVAEARSEFAGPIEISRDFAEYLF